VKEKKTAFSSRVPDATAQGPQYHEYRQPPMSPHEKRPLDQGCDMLEGLLRCEGEQKKFQSREQLEMHKFQFKSPIQFQLPIHSNSVSLVPLLSTETAKVQN
jgi:hypothetical protein